MIFLVAYFITNLKNRATVFLRGGGWCLIWERVAQTLICTYSTRHLIRVHLNSPHKFLAYFEIYDNVTLSYLYHGFLNILITDLLNHCVFVSSAAFFFSIAERLIHNDGMNRDNSR